MALIVDNLECTKSEFKYVLKYYRKNRKDFKQFENDNVALHDFLCDLIRAYRLEYGYIPDYNKIKFEVRR